MVVFFEVAEFVDDDAIDVRFWRLNEFEIQVDAAIGRATAPPFLHKPDLQFGIRHVVTLDFGVAGC